MTYFTFNTVQSNEPNIWSLLLPTNAEYAFNKAWLCCLVHDAQIILLISFQHVLTQIKTSLSVSFFAHCVECLVTWKEGSCLCPCGAVTSLFVVPGDRHLSACSSTEIDPSSDSEENHLVCFVSIPSNPAAALCSGCLGPALLSPETTGRFISVSSRGKGHRQLNNTEK